MTLPAMQLLVLLLLAAPHCHQGGDDHGWQPNIKGGGSITLVCRAAFGAQSNSGVETRQESHPIALAVVHAAFSSVNRTGQI